jgi:erythritol transport system substrate-binding protein
MRHGQLVRGLLLVGLAAILAMSGCARRKGPKLIVVIVPSQDNPFFREEAEAAADRARQLGYPVRVEAHDDDSYKQDNLIDMAIASNATAIILDNAGADSSVAAVRRAERAGIPCFLIDRAMNASGIAHAQIISDNDQGARLVAREFVSEMHGQGQYAELLGKESDTNAQIRTHGFHAVLDHFPNLTLVSAVSANWSQAEAYQKTETVLEAHPEIRGIIAGNDTMALGAAAAVKNAGVPNMRIVGFDGIPDALESIRNGEMQATVLQPAAEIARVAVNEVDRFLKTGSTGLPEKQVVPCELVTRANVAGFEGFAPKQTAQ